MTPQAIVSLDLDGTLIASPFPAVLREVAARTAPDRGDEFRAEVAGRHHLLLADGDVAAYDWAAIIADVTRRFGDTADVDVDLVTTDLAPTATRLLEPETPELLAGLRARGVRLVVITNGYRSFQLPAIRAVGLDTLVDDVVTADDVGAAKPEPAIFAAAYAGHAGPRVHIGDRYDHDVVGAHRSGAASILIGSAPCTDTEPYPDAVAGTFRDAVALVDTVIRADG